LNVNIERTWWKHNRLNWLSRIDESHPVYNKKKQRTSHKVETPNRKNPQFWYKTSLLEMVIITFFYPTNIFDSAKFFIIWHNQTHTLVISVGKLQWVQIWTVFEKIINFTFSQSISYHVYSHSRLFTQPNIQKLPKFSKFGIILIQHTQLM